MSQRQLAAIMFTDIVGYTAMMHEDEKFALKNVKYYKQVLEEETKIFNGNILKHMGDGSITIFESVYQAVKCAHKIQVRLRANPDFKIRVGIHTGEIIYSGDDFYGDGINIASRLQNLAGEGSILFSRDIYEKIQNHPEFQCTHLGKRALKNLKEEIDVYALIDPNLQGNYEVLNIASVTKDRTPKNSFKFRKKHYWFYGITLVILILTVILFVQRNSRIKHTVSNTELASLIKLHSISDPRSDSSWNIYLKALELRKKIHSNPQLEQIWFDITTIRNITSSPPGAKIYIKPYSQPDTSWMYLGETPLYNFQFPKSLTRVSIEKEGFQSQLDVLYRIWNGGDTTFYKLFKPENSIDGMVFVPGRRGNGEITPG